MIFLSVTLVLNCAVSFRSVSKILKIITLQTGFLEQTKIPHYTTIIRWVSRIGYYLLKRPNRKVCSSKKPWICVADHTIQVGTNKAFAVIGIPLKTMMLGRALTLKDATVLSVSVKESWTGEIIAKTLKKIFKKNGYPEQIVIDGAANLNKGFREANSRISQKYHVTYDITHLLAKLLKKKYQGSFKFLSIMNKISLSTKQAAQTEVGYLLPPKIREKSRFLNLPNLAAWFDNMIDICCLKSLLASEKKQIKKYFGWIWSPELEVYIRKFTTEVKAIKDVQKILKNTGINDFSFKKACSKLSEIDDKDFTTSIISALSDELKYSMKIGVPALITSDLIESLFGKYKTIAKPHRLSEINKTVLSMPVICEDVTQNLINKSFSKTSNKEVSRWVKRNIPSTILSRRKIVMDNRKAPNILGLSKNQENESISSITGHDIGVIKIA